MRNGERSAEQGSMLVGLVVAVFLILLALSIAAPTVARELRRDRELETVHRANQYVRAIQLYYKKTGTYPGSIEQLEKTNNIRFLRQKYVDPLTGKADWRLIHVGEAKTTVKGFFGKPLAGVAPGLGSAAGMASGGGIGTGAAGAAGASGASGFGASSGSSFGSPSSSGSSFGSSSSSGSSFGSSSSSGSSFGSSSSGGSSFGSGSGTSGAGGSTDGSGTPTAGGPGAGSTGGIGSQSATSFTGGGAPFVGIGIAKQGDSIIVMNEQTTYQTWEFLYDPRVEQLKAKASLFGGGPTTGGSGLGSASSLGSGVGGASNGSAFGSGGGSSFGSSSGSSFGSSSGSSFGSSSGSSFGSSSPSGSQGSSQGNTPPQ